VEKKSVGLGVAEAAKRLQGRDDRHEMVALILTGIRVRVNKRRRQVRGREGGGKEVGPLRFL
jgi:hypothetical protein